MPIPGVYVSDASSPGDRYCDSVATCMLATGQTNIAPMYSLMAGMRHEKISSTTVTWEDQFPICTTTIVTGDCGDPKGCKIEVSNAEMIHPKTVMYVAGSGEMLYVTGVDDCIITVIRGFACTPCCPLEIDCHIERIASAFEEGSCPENGWTHNDTEASNCTTIIRSTFEITGTAAATKYKSGNKKQILMRETTMRHAEDKERAIFWHRKHSGYIDGRPWRMMDGIDAQIIQNRFKAPPGGVDHLVLDAFLAATFEHNIKGQVNERLFFGDTVMTEAINQIGWNCAVKNVPFNLPDSHSKFGIKFKEYASIHGDMKVFNHPMFRGQAFGGQIYAIHPASVTVHHLGERDNMWQIEDEPGESRGQCDTYMATLTSELTISYCQQSTGSKMSCIKPCYACP